MGETRSGETESAVRIAFPPCFPSDRLEFGRLSHEPVRPTIHMTKCGKVVALQTIAAISQDEILNGVVRPS